MLLTAIRLLALACTLSAAEFIPGRSFDTFITIWLGKQNYADVVDDPNIQQLKKEGILLTNYMAETHPAQPNYLAAVCGDYFGLDNEDPARLHIKVSTVVDLLDWRGLSWKAYMEDVPGPGYMGATSDGQVHDSTWEYVRQHNPFVSFDSINLNGTRLLNIQSFSEWQSDFAAREIPQYAFVSPNMVNNGRNSSLQHATEWAYNFIKPLLVERAVKGRTLIVLTYDEAADEAGPNRVMSLLLGSSIPRDKRGTQDQTFYSHYSMLSTLEFNWGMPTLGRYDAGANMYQFVQDLGSKVLVPNRDPPNLGAVNKSTSYAGILSSSPDRKLAIPAPNLGLSGASEMGVLQHVKDVWRFDVDRGTPYDSNGTLYDGNDEPHYGPMSPITIVTDEELADVDLGEDMDD